MADPKHDNTSGAPPRSIHVEGETKKTNWFAWLALAAGLIALLVALSRCGRDDQVSTVAPATVPAQQETTAPVATSGNMPAATTGTSGLGTYLAGTEGVPRTFTFERLNFDTAKSEVRDADRAEVDDIAAALQKYGTTGVRIVGYADARGSDAKNVALGKARADAVKAALVAKGIDSGRIETASGGETDPVDDNATASGQAENRRTELVVVKR